MWLNKTKRLEPPRPTIYLTPNVPTIYNKNSLPKRKGYFCIVNLFYIRREHYAILTADGVKYLHLPLGELHVISRSLAFVYEADELSYLELHVLTVVVEGDVLCLTLSGTEGET